MTEETLEPVETETDPEERIDNAREILGAI